MHINQISNMNASENISNILQKTAVVPQWLFDEVGKFGISLFTSVLILVFGFWAVRLAYNFIEKRMIAKDIDVSVRIFFLPIIRIALKLVVIFAVIANLGVNLSGVMAALTGVAVAVGLALQGSLSNFAAGLLIILFKPFRIGDYIISQGNEGSVESISLLNTVIVHPNGQTIVLPNANVFNNPITNFTTKDFRRIDMRIGISYEDDFDFAKKVILDVIKNNPKIDQSKEITVEINDFLDSSVNLVIRCFVNRVNYLEVLWQLNKEIKYALDKNNITIPYPHRQVILSNSDASESQKNKPFN